MLARYVPGAATDETAAWYSQPGAGGYANRRYDLTDRQGSVIATTDDSGNVLGVNTYDESGNPGSGNIGRFQYDGAPWIPEAGLYHLQARDYSTTLGRFMQADPIGYGDGLNFYNYVHGDPVNGFDPSGTEDTYPPGGCTGTLLCGGGGNFGGVAFLSTSYVNPGCGDCGHWGNSVFMKNVPAGDYTEVGTGRTVTSDGTLSSWVQPWVSDSSSISLGNLDYSNTIEIAQRQLTPEENSIRKQCFGQCSHLPEIYQKPGSDKNTWDFHKCVNERLRDNGLLSTLDRTPLFQPTQPNPNLFDPFESWWSRSIQLIPTPLPAPDL